MIARRRTLMDELEETGHLVGADDGSAPERHEAWRILGRAAWLGGGSSELRAEFEKQFPPAPELGRHLTETLAALRGTDAAAARKAAEELEKLARRNLTIALERTVADPRLVVAICELLEKRGMLPSTKDSESAVQALVQYLESVASRMSYGSSDEVYRALEAVWGIAGPEIRMDVATAMCHLEDPGKWQYITQALEQSGGKHLPALVMALNFAGEPPIDVVPRLSSAMVARFKKSKRPQDWVGALGRLAGPEAVELLEQFRATKVTSPTLEKIERAIANLHRRFPS